MTEQLYYLDMFRGYEPEEPLRQILSTLQITGAELDQSQRTIDLTLFSPVYIPYRYLDEAISETAQVYAVRRLGFKISFPASQLRSIEPEELKWMFVSENSMFRGSLAGCTWEWDGDNLLCRLRGNGKKELEKAAPKIAAQLKQRFGCDVSISFEAGNSLEGKALFEAMERLRSEKISQGPAMQAPEKKVEPAAPTATDVIFGKAFRGNVTAMKDIDLNMGNVIVEGKVFALDHKELPKRNAVVVKFDITDNTSSVRISRFMEKKESDPIIKSVQVGSVVRVLGRLMVDNFTNEMVLKPNAIMVGSMPKRKDTAPGEKRVELHLHTVMSNMDALTSTKAAIKQAAASPLRMRCMWWRIGKAPPRLPVRMKPLRSFTAARAIISMTWMTGWQSTAARICIMMTSMWPLTWKLPAFTATIPSSRSALY